jgi:hypothetical protein
MRFKNDAKTLEINSYPDYRFPTTLRDPSKGKMPTSKQNAYGRVFCCAELRYNADRINAVTLLGLWKP